ncbi:MAG: hypothetical protein WB760_22155, partial [Xanthobacteraceae bacterium]
VPSGAGRGPLYNARLGVRDSIASLRDGITKSWLGPVQTDLDQLSKNVAVPDGGTFEERQARFEARAADIRATAISIAARSNELGMATAGDMRALAAAVSIQPNQPGFSCYDPTLAQRLRQAAEQAAQQADPQLRPANFSEGPAGVANAVKTLWTNVGAYASSLSRFVASRGKDRFSRTESGQPITGRDVIALLATIGVDLGILAMALLNPPAIAPERRDALVGNDALLHVPSEAVIQHLTRAIRTAIARAGNDVDFEWVRRHFIHHNGASYFVIPNLYNTGQDKNEELRALAMNQLAGVFADLKLVRALTPKEYKRLGKEENLVSYSNVAPFRQKWNEEHPETPAPDDKTQGARDKVDKIKPIRNHGVLSKAQRALEIAGWSAQAQGDTEISRLIDTGGLTPLLMVLNDDAKANGAGRSSEGVPTNGSMPNGIRLPAAMRPAQEPRNT